MFKKGDFVRVFEKKAVFDEASGSAYDFGGEILAIFPKTYLIKFDSFSLGKIKDEFIIESIVDDGEPFEYLFFHDELELMERRDTDEELAAASAIMQQRYDELLEKTEGSDQELSEEEHEKIQEKWIAEFLTSPQFEALNAVQKENAEFACDMTMHYMYNYLWSMPGDWSASEIVDLCLDILPRKVSAGEDFFNNYSTILQAFIQFQGKQNYISNADLINKAIKKIEKDIPATAKNPNNWGMAKSFFGDMLDAGVDIDDERAVERYIMEYNGNINRELPSSKSDPRIIGPSKENPYKHIGRNDRINVRYADGKIVESIKFKKVNQDLLDGKCEII